MNRIGYDVFIAFYNSETGSSDAEAKSIYDYLSEKGIKCYLYSQSGDRDFKANFARIMQSKLFLFVYKDGLKQYLSDSGELDKAKNYHLYVEMDCFLALTQTRDYGQVPTDAAIVYFNSDDIEDNSKDPSLSNLHPLFYGRDSVIMIRKTKWVEDFQGIYKWVKQQIPKFSDDLVSKEVLAVLSKRKIELRDLRVSGVDFRIIFQDIKKLKCIGISNWTLGLFDGCRSLVQILKNNAEIEMLFLDPDGDNVQIRAKEECLSIKDQIQTSFHTIKCEFSTIQTNLREKITLYTYDLLPRENMIFIYTNTQGNYAFIQHYSYNRAGAKSPCMVLKQMGHEAGDNSVFSYYEELYAEIKEKSVPKLDLFNKE